MYELPGIARCARKTRTDVPGAGRDDRVDPDARTYAARIGRQRTGRSGYAAASTFRQARLVQPSLTQVAADRRPASGRIAISERKSQKLSVAVRIESITRSHA